EMGYLVYLDKNRKRLINRKALFEKWIEAFSEKFRPNILRGTFRFVKPEPFRPDVLKQTLKPFPGTFFGGESAAQLITGYLKAGTLTLYTTGDTIDIVKTLKILPDDTGPVTILDVFWNPDYYAQHLLTPDFPGIVPFPLVYADLVISGDERNLEGAKVLYEKYLQNIIQ
ncbi:MAG: hypothetical protein GY757_57700, partial [bacterium]|nr:hypothetical protein [bacterium]